VTTHFEAFADAQRLAQANELIVGPLQSKHVTILVSVTAAGGPPKKLPQSLKVREHAVRAGMLELATHLPPLVVELLNRLEAQKAEPVLVRGDSRLWGLRGVVVTMRLDTDGRVLAVAFRDDQGRVMLRRYSRRKLVEKTAITNESYVRRNYELGFAGDALSRTPGATT
jgi:hypothetical protein